MSVNENGYVETEARGPCICIEDPTGSVCPILRCLATWKRSQQIVPRASESYIRIRENKDIALARLCLSLEVAGVSKALSEVNYTRFSPKRDQTKP